MTVKTLLRGNAFGDVGDFTTTFDRFKPVLKGDGTWKEQVGPASGTIFDLGSHLVRLILLSNDHRSTFAQVDQVLDLFGTPASLTAFKHNVRQQGPPELDDTFVILMHYPPAPPKRKLPLTVTARTTMLSAIDPQLRFQVRHPLPSRIAT